MPTYTYECSKCHKIFELYYNIKDYIEHPKCQYCKSIKTNRSYTHDVMTQCMSIKKSDNELKTLGDLANRNRDKMSEDHKQHLEKKHNSYKEQKEEAPLPKGMSRIKKSKSKIKWT